MRRMAYEGIDAGARTHYQSKTSPPPNQTYPGPTTPLPPLMHAALLTRPRCRKTEPFDLPKGEWRTLA